MAIGSKNSYATTQAPTDNILQSMQYVDQLDYRAKQDKAKEDAAKAKKQQEDEASLSTNLAKFSQKNTGSYNIDNIQGKTISVMAEQYANNRKLLDNNVSLSKEERYRLMAENDKLMRNVSSLSQSSQMFLDKKKELADNISKGVYNPNDEKDLQEWSKSLENMDVRIDGGNLLFSSYEKDEDGNIISVKMDDTDLNGLLSQMDRFKASKYDDFKTNFYKNNQLDVNDIQSGFTSIESIKVTPEKELQAENAAKVISTNDDEMYQKWYEMKGEKKRSWNESERKEVQDYVKKDLINGWKETYKKDIDQSALTGRMNALKEDEDKKPSYNVVETPQEYYNANVKPAIGYKTVSITQQKQIPVNNIQGYIGNKQETFNNVFLNSYTVEKDANGKRSITAQITYPDVKTSSLTPQQKQIWDISVDNPESLTPEQTLEVSRITKGAEFKTKVVRLNEKDAVKFKNTIGANNANEMKDLARVGKEQKYDEYGVEIK